MLHHFPIIFVIDKAFCPRPLQVHLQFPLFFFLSAFSSICKAKYVRNVYELVTHLDLAPRLLLIYIFLDPHWLWSTILVPPMFLSIGLASSFIEQTPHVYRKASRYWCLTTLRDIEVVTRGSDDTFGMLFHLYKRLRTLMNYCMMILKMCLVIINRKENHEYGLWGCYVST